MSLRAEERWWSPWCERGDVVVLHVDLTANRQREARACSLLDEDERARWDRFIHDGARLRFGLCRAALRIILSEWLACHNRELGFGYTRREKPFALVNGSPASVSFNVSHSGSHGLIAVAPSGRIGVDVEERAPRRDFDRLIEAAFGRNEQAALNNASGENRTRLFYKLWTIKEALIKALGTGLSYDPADFEAPPSMRNGAVRAAWRFPRMPALNWRVDDLGDERFAAALARQANPAANGPGDLEIERMLTKSGSPRP